MNDVATRDDGRLHLGRLSVDRVDLRGALDAIEHLVDKGDGGTVFTPNVDHVVLADGDDAFRRAYESADLCLADGMPIVWVSRLFGDPLPEKVSGSDLVEPLMERAAAKGWKTYLLGGGDGVAQKAARALRQRHPRLRIVGAAGPRIDLTQSKSTRRHVLEDI
ncbi:MAG: WecB/TagA/CpsF family glycosyltransferase, partial [Polyangiaceae bacterium]